MLWAAVGSPEPPGTIHILFLKEFQI